MRPTSADDVRGRPVVDVGGRRGPWPLDWTRRNSSLHGLVCGCRSRHRPSVVRNAEWGHRSGDVIGGRGGRAGAAGHDVVVIGLADHRSSGLMRGEPWRRRRQRRSRVASFGGERRPGAPGGGGVAVAAEVGRRRCAGSDAGTAGPRDRCTVHTRTGRHRHPGGSRAMELTNEFRWACRRRRRGRCSPTRAHRAVHAGAHLKKWKVRSTAASSRSRSDRSPRSTREPRPSSRRKRTSGHLAAGGRDTRGQGNANATITRQAHTGRRRHQVPRRH